MGCDERLAQRQSAIVGRDLVVGENVEALLAQQGRRVAEQAEVLKRAATQADTGMRSQQAAITCAMVR